MYTDRATYRPNDTMDVFGVIKPRYGHSHLASDEFSLRIGDMIEMPITLDSHNNFAVRVPVTDMFGWLSVVVSVNGENLMSSGVSFRDYTNISFVTDSTLDKVAHLYGEYAYVEISVSTFAGLPVEGVNLRHWRDGATMYLVTDGHGVASEYIPIPTSWGIRPHWSSFWFSIASDAQMSQSIGMSKIIVPRDIMLEYEFDGNDTATITTHMVDIDRLNAHFANQPSWSFIDPDIYRGSAIDIDFSVEITRYVTTRTIRSQTYDHINRRTINLYDFDTTSSVYRTMSGRTENGTATLIDLPTSDDPLVRYSIMVIYHDSRGHRTEVTLSGTAWHRFRQESSIRHFGFVPEDWSLGVGETTNISLVEGDMWWGTMDGDVVTDGSLLTIVFRDRIVSATVGRPEGTPLTFTEELISSAIVFGAYFDGQHIFPIQHPITLRYDYTERELEISLSFDQGQYQPGDEVTVVIQTSVPAQVLISVVDESAILDTWHRADFLSRLYRSSGARWPSIHQFASHTQHNFGGAGGGAEGGGGGDEGGDMAFRDRFIDNPIFEIVQTDANGRGELTFILPDQVTSWRVTAIGLSADGYAGDSRYNIISSLDFYIDLLLTNEYIAGDDIAALARVRGASRDAQIEFVFNVLYDESIIYTDTQVSGRTAVLNAGKLDVGEYTMQVMATYGGYSDAVELPFSVVESGMILPIQMAVQISDDTDIFDFTSLSMRQLPVRVTLTNANIGPVVNILHNARGGSSLRTDYMAANAFIDYFFAGVENFDVVRSRLHHHSGGIAELPYEDADLFYTARFVASFPEFVARDMIVRYARTEMDTPWPMRVAASLFALAAVGEPVLLEIQNAVYNLEADDHISRLYLIAALVAIGDDMGAMALLTELPNDFVQEFSTSRRETANTLLLFINTTLNPEAAWAHINRGYANRYVSDVAERINFVRHVLFLGETISEVQYYLNGEVYTVRLEGFDRVHLQLSMEQFDALNLVPISGATDFHINFYGYGSDNWDADSNLIDIRRTITRDGEMFRIDLHVALPPDAEGLFTIYDRLPSNMRFVQAHNWRRRGGQHFSVRNVQRQLVEVSFWQSPSQPSTRIFNYHAMELFEANMAEGTTYISRRRVDNHIWGATR